MTCHFREEFNNHIGYDAFCLILTQYVCFILVGLKDLADFLPASLATIVSYFSAEVTRGIWKPALMNGTDWPSPAANLSNVEEQIKKILAATGVDIPSLAAGIRIIAFPSLALLKVVFHVALNICLLTSLYP